MDVVRISVTEGCIKANGTASHWIESEGFRSVYLPLTNRWTITRCWTSWILLKRNVYLHLQISPWSWKFEKKAAAAISGSIITSTRKSKTEKRKNQWSEKSVQEKRLERQCRWGLGDQGSAPSPRQFTLPAMGYPQRSATGKSQSTRPDPLSQEFPAIQRRCFQCCQLRGASWQMEQPATEGNSQGRLVKTKCYT